MDRKQTGSPGVTAGFRFPRRHRRFPSEGSRSGDAAEGLPFLLPQQRQRRPGRPVVWGLGSSGRRARRGRGPSGHQRRPVTQQHARAGLRPAGAGQSEPAPGRAAKGERRWTTEQKDDWLTAGRRGSRGPHLGAGNARANRKSGPREWGDNLRSPYGGLRVG